ncbi:hypothetical protein [Parabacteroides sp. Marseille-P3160]|uniref:hypothetical protein n=1 Tax=Parabacteroides sp. Marseille-P3160 TaxID=1917887 RepID=UPI0009BBC257|nr:hypothetical protein [Parabacteroides sp. Marseille-P3160]
MRNYIIELIKCIVNEKKERKLHPTHAMLHEIKEKLQSDLSKELDEMEKEGLIEIGHTINSKFVKIQ